MYLNYSDESQGMLPIFGAESFVLQFAIQKFKGIRYTEL
jgi:hypothetical protein